MVRQLPLDLPHQPAMARADFLVTPSNQAAHDLVMRWPHWPAPWLLLHGPAGSGKTHLAEMWRRLSSAVHLNAAGLTAETVPAAAETGAAILEIPGDSPAPAAETALFHLINYVAELGAALLITARAPAPHWPVTLPDLRTRLNAMPSAHIGAPDDSLLGAVLAKQFRDRQVAVPDGLIPFLVARMERSLAAARALAAALDAESLASKRPITVRLASDLLQRQAETQGAP